jgi:hypothetical protein
MTLLDQVIPTKKDRAVGLLFDFGTLTSFTAARGVRSTPAAPRQLLQGLELPGQDYRSAGISDI